MSESNKHDKAKKLIDEFVANLIELNNGEPIPAKWKIVLSDTIKTASKEVTSSKPGPKPDIKKELPIVTEYLRILCKENPYQSDDGREIDYPIPDEEEAEVNWWLWGGLFSETQNGRLKPLIHWRIKQKLRARKF